MMQDRTAAIAIGAGLSVLLLIGFGILKEIDAKFLNLSSQWIFISILPVLVSLFVGGYISKFKGFGVELESALNASVSASIELKATDAISDIPGDEKQSLEYLHNLPKDKALSIRWLVFESGRKGYYTPYGIKEYLEKLPNIEFLEVRTKEGSFVCYLPIDAFKLQGSSSERFDMNQLEKFVRAIDIEDVKGQFLGVAISLTVKSSNSLVEVLRSMRDENVDMAAVASDSGRYLGVLFSRDVEKKVADAVLTSKAT